MRFTGPLLRRSLGPLVLALACLASPAHAARLDVTVQNADGEPVENAVVYAVPLGSDGAPVASPGPVAIDQINKEYVPYVTAVRVGTSVQFPNKDQIRHHVYSFSQVKKFEIPLYAGTPAEPIVFDKPGPVALGCNIHDWMRAYVFVSESPYFAVTAADGKATLDAPPGDYAVEVWHPELKSEPSATRQRASLGGPGSALSFEIEQKRVWAPRRAPSRGGEGSYR